MLLSIIYFGQSIFLPGGIINGIRKVKANSAEQFDAVILRLLPTDLQEDLGADSLDVVDLLMSIEDEFEVEVLMRKHQDSWFTRFYIEANS